MKTLAFCLKYICRSSVSTVLILISHHTFKKNRKRSDKVQIIALYVIIIPAANEVVGVCCVHPACLSVCFLSVGMILSTHVLKKWMHGFFLIFFTRITHNVQMCTWNFHIDLIMFINFSGFFCLWIESFFL